MAYFLRRSRHMIIHGDHRLVLEVYPRVFQNLLSYYIIVEKGDKIIWSKNCQDKFDKLKGLLTTTPSLKLVNPYKYFSVCVYASKEGLGGVLKQDEHVICYESHKLKEHERNYVTHNLDLAVVIHALKMWWYYLMGSKFILLIDNSGVRHLFSQHDLNVRQERWFSLFSEFDFEVRHIKGK